MGRGSDASSVGGGCEEREKERERERERENTVINHTHIIHPVIYTIHTLYVHTAKYSAKATPLSTSTTN